MTKLKKAQLIQATLGKANPTLTRYPSEITFFDIYSAVEDKANLFHTNPTTNSDCPDGAVIQKVLETHYHSIQKI